jgi:hypothetical protein
MYLANTDRMHMLGGMESLRDEILRELDRITIRLTGLNPERLAAMGQPVFECATVILKATKEQEREHELNAVGPSAFAAQLTVLTRELLAHNPEGESNAAAALTELRRALP